ncbi:MAG: methyltransferase domain-containing protein [Alphaproteobacteria bacterium]
MWSDVVDFNRFYRGRLGQTARDYVRTEIRRHWPNAHGLTVVGIGYATPYLDQFTDEAARVVALMPAHQGVTHWPRGAPSRVALTDEVSLPLEDMSVDRLLLVHAVENAEHLRAMMRECWRVLSGHGLLLAVVPARRGIWSRTERTPFGHGKPFSKAQMEKLLKDALFEPVSITRGLYMPPSESELILRMAPTLERLGRRWVPRLGGALFVEAQKQVYAGTPARRLAFRPRLVPVPSMGPAVAGRHNAHRNS